MTDRSPRRVGIDPETKEFVIFDQTSSGEFHGHVRSWKELRPQDRAILRKEFDVTKGGKVPDVRGTAILCLGHFARIHRRLPEKPVVEIVNSGLRDEAQYVRGQAENAADDIETFLPELGSKLQRLL